MTAPSPSVEEPLGILFSDVTRLFWRRLEAAFHGAGLDFTSGEARVLITLADHFDPDGLRQNRLAECLHIEPMTLVGHLDRLAAKGMIERRPDAVDRRAKRVGTTPAGRDTVERLRAVSARVKAAMVAGFEVEEVHTLARLLPRLRANLLAVGTDGATA
jgi:DNA-binding MarR family transcriptional regulator